MSHIVTIQTEVRDAAAIQAACERLRIPPPKGGMHRLFSDTVSGLAVELPGWHYPAVCNLQSGRIEFDNYEGHWGDRKELDRFVQAYAVEKAKLEARRKGYSVTEQPLADGSIQLTVHVGGAA